ncbi:MAG: SCP2 sterol-binding domain-containing protein [Actinomycetota bacterium]|nr:SCP2 sterol-binding domain-containing protein [Actinomycetota bacterium]
MDTYPFLSDEWIAAARKIREEHGSIGTPLPNDIRMNQVITEVPPGDRTVDAHIDTTSGNLEMELGHLENPDVTITLDYETAKSFFVEGATEAGMQAFTQAFMGGKVRVQGDLAKLLAALQQVAPPDPAQVSAVQQQIRDITA